MVKIKFKTKQRAIRLNLDNTFDELKVERKGAKLKDKTGDVLMQPSCVFIERKKRGIFRGKRKIVLFVEGTARALKFRNVEFDKTKGEHKITDANKDVLDDLQPFWTQGEAKEFVAKKTAESLMQHRPLKWTQFIILMIPTLIILFVVVKLALNFGAL